MIKLSLKNSLLRIPNWKLGTQKSHSFTNHHKFKNFSKNILIASIITLPFTNKVSKENILLNKRTEKGELKLQVIEFGRRLMLKTRGRNTEVYVT